MTSFEEYEEDNQGKNENEKKGGVRYYRTQHLLMLFDT